MNLGMMRSRLRCATVWAGATGLATALTCGVLPTMFAGAQAAAHGDLLAAGFDDLLVWGCSAAAVAVTWWLWLVASLVTLDLARGLPTARRGVPLPVRRAL